MLALKMIIYSLDHFGLCLLGVASFFMKKIPMVLPVLVFTFLLWLVRNPQNISGVCTTGLIASIAVYFFYNEKNVLKILSNEELL
jgi:hypothetical protein